MNRRFRKLWLCAPFAVIGTIDATITLCRQNVQYWEGNRSALNEGFPLFAKALHHSPIAFAALFAGWVLVFSIAIILLPDLLSEILSLALVNGHTWGVMTWLIYDLNIRYEITLLFFILTAVLFVLCDRI